MTNRKLSKTVKLNDLTKKTSPVKVNKNRLKNKNDALMSSDSSKLPKIQNTIARDDLSDDIEIEKAFKDYSDELNYIN